MRLHPYTTPLPFRHAFHLSWTICQEMSYQLIDRCRKPTASNRVPPKSMIRTYVTLIHFIPTCIIRTCTLRTFAHVQTKMLPLTWGFSKQTEFTWQINKTIGQRCLYIIIIASKLWWKCTGAGIVGEHDQMKWIIQIAMTCTGQVTCIFTIMYMYMYTYMHHVHAHLHAFTDEFK